MKTIKEFACDFSSKFKDKTGRDMTINNAYQRIYNAMKSGRLDTEELGRQIFIKDTERNRRFLGK